MRDPRTEGLRLEGPRRQRLRERRLQGFASSLTPLYPAPPPDFWFTLNQTVSKYEA